MMLFWTRHTMKISKHIAVDLTGMQLNPIKLLMVSINKITDAYSGS